ncbi:MAG TPA: four helix bundle protein [Terriglobales bacterium]
MNQKTDLDLRSRTKTFALSTLCLCRDLPAKDEARTIGRQLLRSSTSVGANYRAACRARTKTEFIAKLGIVLEEADESAFWLELLSEGGIANSDNVKALLGEANQLISIFVTSIRTAKGMQE